MKKEINWEKHYNGLRIMHSMLKGLTKEKLGKIPVWFGEPKKLPIEYMKVVWRIDELLYKAEKITVNK